MTRRTATSPGPAAGADLARPARLAVLGAAGQIGRLVVESLSRRGVPARACGREVRERDEDSIQYRPIAGYGRDQIAPALAGCSSVIATLGLPYRARIWSAQWPGLVSSVADACADAALPLTLLDNLYAYGRPAGPLTEQSPLAPCSRKGTARLEGWRLLEQRRQDGLDVVTGRAADFIGAGVQTTILPWRNIERCARGRARALTWLGSLDAPHSLASARETADALVAIALDPAQRGDPVVHLPVLVTVTGREFTRALSAAAGHKVSARALGKPVVGLAGLVSATAREQHEMMYAVEDSFILSDATFRNRNPRFPAGNLAAFLSRELAIA
jgi:nucleoside-diphosphate-sugar epimerase